jgi:hypothetical protein
MMSAATPTIFTPSHARSDERARFLADVVINAVEGEVLGQFVELCDYDWHDPQVCAADCGHQPGPAWARATFTDYDGGATGVPRVLDPDVVARGIDRIVRGDVPVRAEVRRLVREASAQNYAGDLDAVLACEIAEAAWFGKVVWA